MCGPEGAGELGRGVSVWGGGPGASGAHAQRTTQRQTGGLRAERGLHRARGARPMPNPGARVRQRRAQAAHAKGPAGGLCGGKARAAERT